MTRNEFLLVLHFCNKGLQDKTINLGCGGNYFSKCFLYGNALKWYFFILKKLFLISAYQNDQKTLKNY
jgi:hypothetical protein